MRGLDEDDVSRVTRALEVRALAPRPPETRDDLSLPLTRAPPAHPRLHTEVRLVEMEKLISFNFQMPE